jgi:hypothetical protein
MLQPGMNPGSQAYQTNTSVHHQQKAQLRAQKSGVNIARLSLSY